MGASIRPVRLAAAERPLLRRTERLEKQFTEMEAHAGVNTWGEIMDGLGLLP